MTTMKLRNPEDDSWYRCMACNRCVTDNEENDNFVVWPTDNDIHAKVCNACVCSFDPEKVIKREPRKIRH